MTFKNVIYIIFMLCKSNTRGRRSKFGDPRNVRFFFGFRVRDSNVWPEIAQSCWPKIALNCLPEIAQTFGPN